MKVQTSYSQVRLSPWWVTWCFCVF